MREMIPLAEIDPAVCVVGDPIVADRPSTDVSERPARLLDGASEAGKHALFTEKSTREVLVKEGPLKFSIGGCIARTKIEGFGDTDERFISDTSDISMEDTRPTTPQKQVGTISKIDSIFFLRRKFFRMKARNKEFLLLFLCKFVILGRFRLF